MTISIQNTLAIFQKGFAGVLLACTLILVIGVEAAAQGKQCPDDVWNAPIYWDSNRLAATKAAIQSDDADYQPAYQALIRRADAALTAERYSVTDKERAGPSGDKHDYVSLSRYFWPDPKTDDGLPYIRKDGRSNPELDGINFDRRRSQNMTNAVRDLSLAAYLSGEQIYADKALRVVYTWFLDKELRMNPHLNFAQSVPGKQDGREFGILDGRIYWDVIDGLLLLQSADMADQRVVDAVRGWFGEYAAWLITSDFGKKAKTKKNNHGVFYDAQLSHVLIFAGRCDLAKKSLKSGAKRAKEQIKKSGLMPEEKERTRSLFYHTFNAEAFIRISYLARKFDIEYYDASNWGAGSVKDTVALVGSYAGRTDEWPYEEISENVEKSIWSMLMQARLVDDSADVREGLERLTYQNTDNYLNLLVGP